MNKEQAVSYLRFSGFSDEQIKTIEGAFACEDAISRQAVIDEISKARDINLGILPTGHRSYEDILRCVAMAYDMGKDHALNVLRSMPPVNPQKSICPSAGVDCEDYPAYEDTISRKAVIDTLERMDRALDEDRTVENYKELLRECYKVLPSAKSEWEHAHEILKAYSDGASAVLDKVRAEIDEEYDKVHPYDILIAEGLERALDIIDKYIEEDKA